MNEGLRWDQKPMGIRLGIGLVSGVVSSRMVDRYGWGDGLIRGVAFALLLSTLTYAVLTPEWVRSVRPFGRVALGAQALACVLYLVATFGLGERGPGGALCAAALALFAIASAGIALRPDLAR